MFGTRGVAEAYTKTLEFRAKDAQIKRAVEKLAKSLTAIDEIVDKINGKFVKNLKGSIGDISKELKNTVKIATDLGKVFTDNAKKAKKLTVEMERQRMIAKVQTKSETQRLEKIEKIEKAIKQKSGKKYSTEPRGKTFGGGGMRGSDEPILNTEDNKALRDAEEALVSYMDKLGQAQNFYSKNEKGLLKQIAAFKNLASGISLSKKALEKQTVEYKLFSDATRGQAIAEQNLLKIEKERIRVRKELVVGGGLIEGGRAASKIGIYDTAETLLDKDAGNTLAEMKLYKSQLEDAVEYLEMNTTLWDQVNSRIDDVNEGLGITTDRQREALKAQKAFRKEIEKAQKEVGKTVEWFSKLGPKWLGLIRGKGGPVPQVLAGFAGLEGSLELIKQITRFMPFLDKKIKAQVKSWTQVGQTATTVLTGVKLGSMALSGVLGATSWVANAVKGFIEFEDIASQVIWSIEGQMSKAFSLFGRLARELPHLASQAMMVMPEAFGGAGLPMGDATGFSDLWRGKGTATDQIATKAEALMSGRNENRRYRRQGPTGLKVQQEALTKLETQLSQRNRSARDYGKILNQVVFLEKEISAEVRKQKNLRDLASGKLEREGRRRRAATAKRRRDRQAEIKKAEDEMYMDPSIQQMMTGIDPNAPGGRRVKKGAWERLQRRRSNRSQMNARMREGLMLGAGFPILFGGGVGSVAGGVGGALAQSKMGPGAGFGAQILLSAVGQSIDAFVVKTAEMGKALGDFTKDTGALTEALGLAGTAEGQRIKNIQAAEGEQAAFDATVKQLTATVGEVGVQRLKDFGEQWTDLMMSMQAGLLRVQSATAGMLLWFDKFLGLSERAKRDRILTFARQSDDAKIKAAVAVYDKNRGDDFRGGAVRQKLLQPVIDAATPAFNKMIGKTKEDQLYGGSKLESTDKEIERLERIFQMKSGDREALERTLEIEREVEGVQSGQVDKLKEKLRYKKELEDANEVLKKQEEELKAVYDAIGVSIRDGLVEGLNAAIDGTKTLGEVASNTFRRISNALLNYGVNLGLSALPGGLGTFFQGALGMAGKPGVPVAPGSNVSMDSSVYEFDIGPDPFKAKGGPVTGGSPYVVGEKGPELFVPGTSGNIVPNHAMGGSNVVVNVDASGSSVEGDSGAAQELGSMLAAAVQAEIANQQRPGGLLARR